MSDSDSDESVGARAARERYQPGTQEDYNNSLKQMEDYVKETFSTDHPSYSRCLENGKLRMPVDFAVSKLFLRDRVQNRLVPWPDDTRDASRRTHQKHLSLSAMTTAVSAMRFSYRRSRTSIPAAVVNDYSNIWMEYKLFVGNERMNGDMPMVEGAAAITWDAYHFILEAAMLSKPSGRGSAESAIVNLWPFLIIAWATLCRGERVGRIQLSFIHWVGDALTIKVPTSKSDAAGLMSYAKLCFANCNDFTSCVVTALGTRVCSGLQDAQYLFGTSIGEAHYIVTKMRSALKDLVCSLPKTADHVLQANRSMLSMHMPKKSGIRHCNSCGITGMNTPIHLRADHKMGPYDLQSDCDGILGRVLAGLKPFDLPPPHFHPAVAAAVPWAEFIPSYIDFPEQFQQAIPNIVASVVWHNVALSSRLPKTNPLLGSPLFTTHRYWLTRLFPYLHGGTSGKSFLTPSGRCILMEVSDNVSSLLKSEMRLSVPSEHSLKFSDQQMRQLQECVASSQQQASESWQNSALHTVMPLQASQSCATAWANVMPLLFLNAEFRFPIGLLLEDAYRRWFCAVPPLPALHLITAKMIPPCESKQHRKTQKSLRSKFAGCMQVIHGLTPPEICKRNVAFTWSRLWPRVVALYSIREPCSWTVATAFQKFYSDKSRHSQAINMPSLAVEDVPVSCTEPSVAWTAATTLSTQDSMPKIPPAKQGRHDGVQMGNSLVRQRNDACEVASVVAVSNPILTALIPTCQPSLVPHVSRRDDWSEAAYILASKEARYLCPFPSCEEHFGSTSGIRHHWKSIHSQLPVPELLASRTRIRVDASDAVQALRNIDATIACALAAEGEAWRKLQASNQPDQQPSPSSPDTTK
jgi:hypothetical protein